MEKGRKGQRKGKEGRRERTVNKLELLLHMLKAFPVSFMDFLAFEVEKILTTI